MKKAVIKNPQKFRDFMATCSRVFALDTETTSLDWLDLEMIGFSICDGNHACYIELSTDNKDEMLTILDYYISEARILIMHNSPFDLMVLRKEGIRL